MANSTQLYQIATYSESSFQKVRTKINKTHFQKKSFKNKIESSVAESSFRRWEGGGGGGGGMGDKLLYLLCSHGISGT